MISACDTAGKKSTAAVSTDPCNRYERLLTGPFSAGHMRGAMIFSGGLTGTMEVVGVDYNEMTCTYNITDCTTGTTQMNCDGAPYETTITFETDDRIKINNVPYDRGEGVQE